MPKVIVLVTVEPSLSPPCQVRLWEFSREKPGYDKKAVPDAKKGHGVACRGFCVRVKTKKKNYY